MASADYVVVGSGLTGATIARRLRDAGKDVLVVEARDRVGGNVADHVHLASGIRIHTYGPHYFRTNSARVWEWVNRFATFYRYEARVRSLVGGRLEQWPVSEDYLRRECGPRWAARCWTGHAANFHQAAMSLMPVEVYERFVRGYTEKQWGAEAHTLSAALAKRFDVRAGGDDRFSTHEHQGLPTGGYSSFVAELLRGVPLALGEDYLVARDRYRARKLVVYTGPLDALFGWDLGPLPYRAQRRVHRAEHLPLGADFAQEVGQVNYPDPARPEIRQLEWRHMMSSVERVRLTSRVTVLTTETPYTPDLREPGAQLEYPFPSPEAEALARAYLDRAGALPDVLVCGRLGEYRYLDMDQAVARALLVADRVLGLP